jgi:hypothetical protein
MPGFNTGLANDVDLREACDVLEEVRGLADQQKAKDREPLEVAVGPGDLEGENWKPRRDRCHEVDPQRGRLKNRQDLTRKRASRRDGDGGHRRALQFHEVSPQEGRGHAHSIAACGAVWL